jgi:hypothetical protein
LSDLAERRKFKERVINMTIITYEALKNLEYWCGAKAITDYLTDEEFDIIEEELYELYPDGLTMTEINDLFWFDDDFICEIIGYDDFDDFWEKRVINEGE